MENMSEEILKFCPSLYMDATHLEPYAKVVLFAGLWPGTRCQEPWFVVYSKAQQQLHQRTNAVPLAETGAQILAGIALPSRDVDEAFLQIDIHLIFVLMLRHGRNPNPGMQKNSHTRGGNRLLVGRSLHFVDHQNFLLDCTGVWQFHWQPT